MDPRAGTERWLTGGVGAIGAASLLSDAGHEITTALLPSFLTSTLGAPAAALGLIEGISDGASGVAKLAGGAIADDPERRGPTAVGGYALTAVLSSMVGLATNAVQVAFLRAGAWAARGIRGPSRNAILADVVPAAAYGRAFGFERAMDNLGAIAGPLLALLLVSLTSVRTAILLSIVPGLLAALAMLYAARRVVRPRTRERTRLRLQIRPLLRGDLGGLLLAVGAFELGNLAATLMILRVTELLEPSRGQDAAVSVALALYVSYNLAATLASVPAGHLGDRRDATWPLGLGVTAFLVAYVTFAATGPSIPVLAIAFVLAGVGIGAVETAEHHAIAARAREEVRGSAFGLLAAMQSLGNFAASAIAGLLWTVWSPTVAFGWAAAWMAVSLTLLALGRSLRRGRVS
ncbi:MAG TPA: MFS transporter [Actinomycetota bacterium]|nr:MFS transporter [Actinomycetota bacterium]